MLEYAALTSSDPADLARQMTERSAQGWEILHIVSSGATITAFARRAAIAASTASTTASTTQASTAPVAQASTPQPVQASSWASTGTAATTASTAASTPVVTASTPAATASSVGDAAAPAAWYPDPAGRFELRYWNGSAWTEHVSRNGQQSTDAPVA